ncbi:MAG TPA: DUF2934 domain-containing protein [Microvirga sp.]|jgi:hypothetical protein
MDTREDRIRQRAYELWEQSGHGGTPEDHWYQAEREIGSDDRGATTVEDAPPAAAVAAAEAANEGAAPRPSRSRKRQAG